MRNRPHHIRIVFCLALAAASLCAPGASARQAGGSVVVRDAVTGEMRAPTAAELRALRPPPAPGTAATPVQTPKTVTRPDGTRSVTLGEGGMVYSVVTRDADGKVKERCVHGHDAARDAVTTPPH